MVGARKRAPLIVSVHRHRKHFFFEQKLGVARPRLKRKAFARCVAAFVYNPFVDAALTVTRDLKGESHRMLATRYGICYNVHYVDPVAHELAAVLVREYPTMGAGVLRVPGNAVTGRYRGSLSAHTYAATSTTTINSERTPGGMRTEEYDSNHPEVIAGYPGTRSHLVRSVGIPRNSYWTAYPGTGKANIDFPHCHWQYPGTRVVPYPGSASVDTKNGRFKFGTAMSVQPKPWYKFLIMLDFPSRDAAPSGLQGGSHGVCIPGYGYPWYRGTVPGVTGYT
eukprot:3936415-Rhodomonas_salina.3